MKQLKSIAVFCGSSFGTRAEYSSLAEDLGKEIARREIVLIYGGGNRGLMGTIARTVRLNGGTVIGILPRAMDVPEVRNGSAENEIIIAEDMHERKKLMYGKSDAFIAMPGGIGTIEELSEIYTWRQLGYHEKNIGLLNVEGYWDPFLDMLDKGVKEGFISPEVRNLLIAEETPSELIDRLQEESFVIPPKIK